MRLIFLPHCPMIGGGWRRLWNSHCEETHSRSHSIRHTHTVRQSSLLAHDTHCNPGLFSAAQCCGGDWVRSTSQGPRFPALQEKALCGQLIPRSAPAAPATGGGRFRAINGCWLSSEPFLDTRSESRRWVSGNTIISLCVYTIHTLYTLIHTFIHTYTAFRV